MYDFREWRHVFKLDPNKDLDDDALEAICESGTDAVIVGGSDGVTLDNTLNLLARIRRFSVPCVLEISNAESITPGFDFYFIPTVLNSRDAKWVIGVHHETLKEYGDFIDWDEVAVEGYCILNGDSKAGKLTQASADIEENDVIAYARMAQHFFSLPIFYVEYSGMYGDPKLVEQVSKELSSTRLFYGGGIETIDQAEEMGTYADTIVVGNSIYTNLSEALKTVHAVKK
ncbi:heptaprenylglyceryl phosphate synthase [Bacillus solimangrovi]|uniref:Heptaprenylglyceryl phosphate synthase n=1 Tax=Bacillus solimangrovi TaxID=1305675 RepID=A0A1E5LH43_9BACI|nr:heptaprenylglyceryl phosphate synthase [Bacillus solimangrovi]OEH93392.1 geranylgeranylglyceryl/heptaprenylglyceryl phosphate synthase [Bacillus solimangrovi]